MKIWSISIVLFSLLSCKAQPPALKAAKDNNTLLWQVTGKDLKKPSFLFGTFHLLCKGDIKFSDQLLHSLESADKVYMEMDMDDPSVIMSGLMYMNMKNGTRLKDLYSKAEYEKIEHYFTDTLHTPMMLFQNTKPYFLVALLYPRMMKCASPSGVEEELVQIAKDHKKEIKGLETMEFQASVFDSIPYSFQARELLKNIDSFNTNKAEFEQMTGIYKNQQLDSMQKLFTKAEFGVDKYEKLLLTDRNKNWVIQLQKLMAMESVFVAVGAGHLVGQEGLITLLRKAGYTVTPLFNR